MNTLRKLATALRLAARGDLATLRRQWLRYRAEPRLRRHRDTPFPHTDPGFPLVCHPAWPESRDQFLGNQGDHWEVGLLRAWLGPGDVAVDAGANLGFYTFGMADAVGGSGRVLAVEAAPYVADRLRQARELLGTTQVEVIHAALTDRPGTVTLFVSPDHSSTAEQSLRPDPAHAGTQVSLDVPGITFARLANSIPGEAPPAAVKIDIEGAEVAALSAAPPAWLRPDGPLWIVEVNPGTLARFNATAAQLVAHFPPEHFDRWLAPKHPLPGRSAGLRRLDPRAGENFDDAVYYNLIALPRGASRAARRARIQGRLTP